MILKIHAMPGLMILTSMLLAACGAGAQASSCAAGEGEISVRPQDEGFCLRAPDDFSYHQYEAGHHLVYYGRVEELVEPPQPFLMVQVEEHDGRELDEIGAAYLAAYTGIDLAWQEAELDGARALRIDELPGQELGRVMLVVHDGRVFELLFVPDDPDAGQTHARMEVLYQRVIESFRFVDS